MTPDTETLDRLYLEWSQFTAARNRREIKARSRVSEAMNLLNSDPSGAKISDAIAHLSLALRALE